MSKTILLADDSVTIQKVIELTFMDEDYEVIAVGDGDEALDRLEGVSPDVVIADVHMPGASGFDVAKRAKQLHPGAPVLLLVGTFEPFDEADYEASGADAFLKKPFDSQELLQRVNSLLESGPSARPAAAGQAPPELPATGGGFDAAATRAVPGMGGGGDEGVQPLAASDPFASDSDPFPELTRPRPAVGEDDVFGFGEADGSSEVLPPPEMEEGSTGTGFTFDPGDEGEFLAEVGGEDDDFTLASDDDPAAGGGEARAVPAEAAAAETPPSGVPGPAASNGAGRVDALTDADVDRIARRVVDLLGDRVVREVAWEVVPDLAEVAVRDRLAELEGQLEEG